MKRIHEGNHIFLIEFNSILLHQGTLNFDCFFFFFFFFFFLKKFFFFIIILLLKSTLLKSNLSNSEHVWFIGQLITLKRIISS
jgi:hypothetical protein